MHAHDPDRCPCGAVVVPHWVDAADEPQSLERGSCRTCGLQLVRRRGERWREIRG